MYFYFHGEFYKGTELIEKHRSSTEAGEEKQNKHKIYGAQMLTGDQSNFSKRCLQSLVKNADWLVPHRHWKGIPQLGAAVLKALAPRCFFHIWCRKAGAWSVVVLADC